MNTSLTKCIRNFSWLLLATLLVSACGGDEQTAADPGSGQAAVLIATTEVTAIDLPIWLQTVGMVHSRSTPTLAAEVEGRVTMVSADIGDAVSKNQLLAQIDTSTRLLQQQAAQASLERLEVHIANGERRVKRFETLSAQNLSSQSQLEDAKEQLEAFRADYKAAQANLAIVNDSLAKSRVIAPVDGLVQLRFIAEGDFVSRGEPLFEITQPQQLQARLPFAESLALQINVGQLAEIRSPLVPGGVVHGKVTELQPSVGLGNRAITAIVDLDDPGQLRPRATLSGRVLIDTHSDALMVPNISVVRRPAGNTIYVINNQVAEARLVETGYNDGSQIEILSGLHKGEVIATDGAAFLTDGAAVSSAESSEQLEHNSATGS